MGKDFRSEWISSKGLLAHLSIGEKDCYVIFPLVQPEQTEISLDTSKFGGNDVSESGARVTEI